MARLIDAPADGHTVRLGVVSDTHLGSQYQALQELEAVYDEFACRGVSAVMHAGDVFAGVGMYRGQETDELLPAVDTYSRQVDYAEAEYPARDGITTYMIAGNHDLDGAFSRSLSSPVRALASRRRDITYLGDDRASVELTNGATVMIAHGRGPAGYAHSYRGQRFIESLGRRERPDLLILGHFHRAGFFVHDGVSCVLAACFQTQTPFLAANGIEPDVGGFVISLTATAGEMVGMSVDWVGRPAKLSVAA